MHLPSFGETAPYKEMYSRMSWEATLGLMPIGAQHGRGRLMRPKRASSANRSASDGLAWRQPAWLSSQHLESHFFKSVLSRDVALGVKQTRHQLAPAVPGQKIIDCAVAGFVPDGFFVGLRSWMFNISPAPAALAKRT